MIILYLLTKYEYCTMHLWINMHFGSKIHLYKFTNNIKHSPLMRPHINRIIDGPCSFAAGNLMMGLVFVSMSWISFPFSCRKCCSSLNILLICPDRRVLHTEPCSETIGINKLMKVFSKYILRTSKENLKPTWSSWQEGGVEYNNFVDQLRDITQWW